MALTRSFRDTVAARARHDAGFRAALFEEALQAILDGDLAAARGLLRDCINATVGFDSLSVEAGIPAKSLMRMVGPRGNPTLRNLAIMVRVIQEQAGIRAQANVYGADACADAPVIMASSSRDVGIGAETQGDAR